MGHPSPDDLVDALTNKQRDAIALVAQGFTSKEAARMLNIAPATFDRRIEVVRKKFGNVGRPEAARIYRAATDVKIDRYEPLPLPYQADDRSHDGCRLEAEPLIFADAASFVERAPWDRDLREPVPGIDPSRFNAASRLTLMLAGAVLIAAIALLTVGIMEGLAGLR